MTTPTPGSTWDQHRTTIIAVGVVLALVAALVGVRLAVGGANDEADALTIEDGQVAASPDDTALGTDGTAAEGSDSTGTDVGEGGEVAVSDGAPGDATTGGADGGATAGTGGDASGATSGGSDGGAVGGATGTAGAATATAGGTTGGGGGTALPGVSAKEIRIAYYWRGDRTRSSQYLNSAGQSGNVDEGDAFRVFVKYLNENPRGTWMGFDYDLRGRTLVGKVFEVDQTAQSYAQGLADIEAFGPMAAISPTGSQSDFFCPELAARGIHNFATYDLRGNLPKRTNGYCTPAGMPWNRQVELSAAWLKRQQTTDPYTGAERGPERRYGVVYSQLEGLEQGSAKHMLDAFKNAGVNVVSVVPVSPGLTDSQREIGDVIAKFRAAGVNTVVMPDGGAALSFTHGATSNAFFPDYYVWPCSGQDTVGFVRLLDGRQWENAEGLSCYDDSYHSDVTLNDRMTRSQWYAKYKKAAPNSTPPVQAPFVYSAMLPILVGITNAGPDLTLESLRSGLDAFGGYRYDYITGRTNDATRIHVGIGDAATRALVDDAVTVSWNGTRQIPGAATPGNYDYPEKRRYRRAADL